MHAPSAPPAGAAWRPGFARQAPWAAFAFIAVFIACCVGMGVVLSSSKDKPVSAWPTEAHTFPVSVLLSLLVSLANVSLAAALGRAYEIAWWLQAIRGAELRRLKFDLNVQSSIMAIASRGFAVNWFSIAASVALAVSVLDGPLVQKASTIVTQTHGPARADVTATVLNGYLPDDYSGYGVAPDLLTPAFSNVSLAYSNREPIRIAVDGCDGANETCTLDFPGLGFDVDCTETHVAYNFSNLASASLHNNVTTFSVTMAYGQSEQLADFIAIRTNVTYKPDAACAGKLVRRTCALRLSTVNYPLTLSGGVATLASWDAARNDTIAWANITAPQGYGTLWTGSFAAGGFQSMLGGVYSVLNGLYAGSAVLRLATMTVVPYVLSASGSSASNYLTSELSTYSNCTMTWADPTTDYVNTARELMLRSVVSYAVQNPANASATQIAAQRTTVAATYVSQYRYLAAAVACMALEMLVILTLLCGWHRLGRHVSLDAFEIARALGAPLLQGGSSNSEIDECLKPMAKSQLRYGEVLPAPPADFYAVANAHGGHAPPQARRLGLVEAHRAAPIEEGVLY